MPDFQEYPKMLYHPDEPKVMSVVNDEEEELDKLEEWGVAEPPQIDLASAVGAEDKGEAPAEVPAAGEVAAEPEAKAKAPKTGAAE